MNERCRSGSATFINDSDEEESEEQYHQLQDEREKLDEKKNKLEAQYHDLYTHVFKVS